MSGRNVRRSLAFVQVRALAEDSGFDSPAAYLSAFVRFYTDEVLPRLPRFAEICGTRTAFCVRTGRKVLIKGIDRNHHESIRFVIFDDNGWVTESEPFREWHSRLTVEIADQSDPVSQSAQGASRISMLGALAHSVIGAPGAWKRQNGGDVGRVGGPLYIAPAVVR